MKKIRTSKLFSIITGAVLAVNSLLAGGTAVSGEWSDTTYDTKSLSVPVNEFTAGNAESTVTVLSAPIGTETAATTVTSVTETTSTSVSTVEIQPIISTSSTTAISIHGVYFTTDREEAEAEDVKGVKPGMDAAMKIMGVSQAEGFDGTLELELPEGISIKSVNGDESAVKGTDTAEFSGGLSEILFHIDESVAPGVYKVKFTKLSKHKYIDTSTPYSLGGISHTIYYNIASGGTITVSASDDEPQVTTPAVTTAETSTTPTAPISIVISTEISEAQTTTASTTTLSELITMISSMDIITLTHPGNIEYHEITAGKFDSITVNEKNATVELGLEISQYPSDVATLVLPQDFQLIEITDEEGSGNYFSRYSETTSVYRLYGLNKAGRYTLIIYLPESAVYGASYDVRMDNYKIQLCNYIYTYSFESGKIILDEPVATAPAVTENTASTTSGTTASTTVSQTTAVSTTTATVPIKISGDINGDKKLDVRDCAFIASKLAQGKIAELTEEADFNGDGKADVRDAAAIAAYLAKILK